MDKKTENIIEALICLLFTQIELEVPLQREKNIIDSKNNYIKSTIKLLEETKQKGKENEQN